MTVDDSPVRRPGGRTRLVTERLRAAALEIVAENGIDGLQYEALALRAQVARATVYRRWPNRDDLFRDVLTHFAETAVQIEDTGDIARDLTAFLHSFAVAAVTPAGSAVLQILLRRADGNDGLRRVGVELLDRRTGELQRRLDRATQAGQLPLAEAAFVNMMLVGPVQWFVLRRERPFLLEDARAIVDLIVAGLWRSHSD